MQQSERQALNKSSTRKGDIFGYTTQIDTSLPVLVVALSVFP